MQLSTLTLASQSWRQAQSYGRYALELYRAWSEAGVHVNTLGEGAPNRNYQPAGVNVLLGYPTNHAIYGDVVKAGIKVSLTMWESSRLDASWLSPLNACAAVVVPCDWNVQVFRDAGVTAPIHRLPLGVSRSFRYVERKQSAVMRFLVIGDRDERKGWFESVSAFVGAFGSRNDVELLIKVRSELPSYHMLKNLTNPNIRLLDWEMSEAEIAALYASCDVLIFGSKAEGFGLPPREFAATGGIAVCTSWSGLADDLALYGIGVPYTLVPAWQEHAEFRKRDLGVWANVDTDALLETLRQVRAMPFGLRRDVGQAFSDNALRLYNWTNYAAALLDVVKEAVDLDYSRAA